ncbi:hypothetical protein ACLEBP_10115 [Escherichia coli]
MVMAIGQPVVGKNNQGVDAIGPVIDRQLDAGQQRNIFLCAVLRSALNSSKSNLL